MDVTEYLGKETTAQVSYTRRDLILYAIGIGCDELRYVYENESDFAAFPTYPFVLGFKGTDQDVVSFPSPTMAQTMVVPPLSGTKVVLDGERYLEVVNPLPADGAELTLKSKAIGIHARGKGAIVETETIICDSNKVYIRMISGAFLVGAKGFKDAGKTNSENVVVPKRAPDAVEEAPTLPNQAHIYRLSGDYNPLHIEPSFAEMNGFKQPILHGLCTLGHAAHAVIKHFCNNDPANFKSIKCRFAKPVMPGDTLVTEMWKEGNKVFFVVKVKGSDVVVNNAYVELNAKSKL
eukprot:TRINITY_DN2203_c0_g1_i1.p1 TRINITY_DN2203_c0_g1~~TRINITY_DN2203_c0_g1_i1.p1  ORF type:complete len:292 (-),score=68.20 TRINITY_DN2203_c0_g1_i1:134-1009(-)